MKLMLYFCLLFSVSVFAQVTITNSDISSIFAVGNSITINEYDNAVINIGSPGGGNNWDFSALQSTSTFDLLSVNPATAPHTGEFPGANFAIYSQGDEEEDEIWTYLTLNGTFGNMGAAITLNSQPGDIFILKNNPVSIEAQLPMTYNTSWMQTYTQTFYFNGMQINQSSVSTNVNVDAYGTMTLPGGFAFEALRIRETMTVSGLTTVSYSFMSKSGAQVNIQATDANPPTSGNINVDGYEWNLAFTTSVEQIGGLPEDFSISQNYPNPFNPSTKITFSITERSYVELVIYDMLGRKIEKLVSDNFYPGVYTADFNADNLPGGVYIARLSAGNYTRAIKMTLLK